MASSRQSAPNKSAKILEMDNIELEEDNEGGLILACHRRASQISTVSDMRDSLRENYWLDGSSIRAEPTRRFEDHYQLGATLKQAEWTRVHLCHHKTTQQQRIVKVIRETCSHCHEFEILSKLDHPSFPVVHELFRHADQEFYMVLRHYPGGTLEEALQQRWTENRAIAAIWQILVAANVLHHQTIVHCNLRPENILMRTTPDNNNSHLTVINFTNSFVKDSHRKMNYIRGDYSGTDLVYLAPEILQDIPSYDEKSDVWACGVLLYRLLSNTLPFVYNSESDTEEEIRQRIAKGDLQFPERHWKHISTAAVSFVMHLLEPDPFRRPSAAQALQHVWLAECAKELQNQCTPAKNTHSLQILGNLRKYAAKNKEDEDEDHPHPLVTRLRQAICVAMISRLVEEPNNNNNVDTIFNALDGHHQGTIDPKQLAHGYYQAFSRMLPDEVVKNLWQQFGKNSRKEPLQYSEFQLAALGNANDWWTTAKIREAFEYLDKHNKGSISVIELTQANVFSKAGIKEQDIVNVMEMVDTSGSGLVSFLDFKRMMNLEFLEDNNHNNNSASNDNGYGNPNNLHDVEKLALK